MDYNSSLYHQSVFYDAITDLMVVLDLNLKIQWANRSVGASVGEHPENLIGRHCYNVWHCRDIPCEKYPVQSTIQTGMHHKDEVELPDGKVFLIKSYPLWTSEGELKGITEVISDITEYRKAEKYIRRKSEEQALLLESVSTQIWYLSDIDTYGAVNQAHADFCGLSRHEMEYKKPWDVLSEDKVRVCRNGNNQVFQSGEQIRTEEWLHNASGEQRLVEIIKTPKLDASGRVEYVVCSGSDITERKQAEEAIKESESRFRRLLAHVHSVAVQGYNMEGVTIYWNKASEILYGYTAQEALGQNLIDLIIPDEMRKLVQKEIQQMASSAEPIPSSELTMKRKDGSLVPVFSSHTLINKYDGSCELFCIDIDLTEIKKARDEQVRARERAEAANKAKSEFLANMSHELRTPFNGIMGMLQLLQTTSLDEEQEQYVDMSIFSANRLNRLLNDILDLSRIEVGKLELSEEHFQLSDILQSVEDIFRHSSAEKGISLGIHKDPEVPGNLIGDPIRLTQILFNLVGNAVKYTSQGGVQVEVSLITGPSPEACRVLFIVQDSGQGIVDDKLDMVFETFRQAGDEDSFNTKQFEGAGLGLPLVKRLLGLMKGSACIVSQRGEGTTVYVSLPFLVPEAY